MNTAKTIFTDASQAANDLYSFISKNEQNILDGSVVSFVFPVNNINLIAKLNLINDNYDEFFFFEKFDEGYSFVALNCLIELSSNKKDILSLEHDISKLKSQLVSNWSDYNINNIPIVSGGIKFDSAKSSEEWNNFRTIHFFVPQIIILQKEDETFLIYNFQANSKINIDDIVIDFTQSVSAILNLHAEATAKKNIIYESNGEINNNEALWNTIVTEAKKKLDSDLKKIVLSRRIELLVKDDIDWTQMFRELETTFSNCYLFMVKSNEAVFFGASPEKFLSVRDNNIEIDALAGSASGDSTDIESELLNKKNIKEHKYVIDFIGEAISEYAHDIRVDTSPQIKKLKNVQTDNFIYTIQADYLPDNEFIYRGLTKRVETADQLRLPYLHEDTQKLENLIQNKLFDTVPFNEKGVKQLNLTIQPNKDGKLEAVLEYNKRSIILTKE
ncbi:MAG: chorismate-binding protein, partial [Bacteroidetes bacterium]|nr:chorismate-binding protein [Bacteroidota bacterium]